MASETFSPQGLLLPDWGVSTDWSGGTVPGQGTGAVINVASVLVDPLTTLAATITLQGGAALLGNGGGFVIAGSVTAEDSNALYGDGAVVNNGEIDVAGAATLRIVVEAGAAAAASYGLSVPSFLNAGQLVVSRAATLSMSGTEFSNIGTVDVAGGVLSVAGGWVDGGQGALTPGGTIELSRGGFAYFGDGVTGQTFAFEGRGTISFGDPHDVSGDLVTGFAPGDEILTGSAAAARGLLAQALSFGPLPSGERLTVKAVSGGAAIVLEDDPPCFARGTRILTPAGYVPVEAIRPDDLVVTAAGETRPVRWVGWRTIDLAAMRRPEPYWPVRITAGAMAPGVPARDLHLSPDHAVLLDGWLVPVKLLVNSATILRDRAKPAVTYFHLELDRHEVLLAEGLPAESYLDTGNRGRFASASGKPAGPPAFGRGKQWDPRAYANLCTGGPGLRAIRQALLDRVAALGYRHQVLRDVELLVDGDIIRRSFGPAALPCFQLNKGHDTRVTIRSASFVPAEMSAGDDEDWRRLGVCVRRVKLGLKSVTASRIALGGFHPRGAHDISDWTDGQGVIAVPEDVTDVGLNILALPKRWLAPFGRPG